MSDSVRITLIIATTVVIALISFRRRLSSFFFKATRDGCSRSFSRPKGQAVL
jgi:hypothetical protein